MNLFSRLIFYLLLSWSSYVRKIMGFENLKVDFRPFPGGFRSSKYHISTYLVKLHPNPRKNRGVNPIIFAENPLSCFEKSAKNKKIALERPERLYLTSKWVFWVRRFFGFFGVENQNFFFLQMKIENYGVFIWKNPIIFFSKFRIMGFLQMKTP